MAELKPPKLTFGTGCPDCGSRDVELPKSLIDVGDDFDWNVRDYDGFRLFMMQELAARFPERRRWTPADVEVAIIEVFAYLLDQLSDTLDRVSAEAHLETARQPESVRRLLELIGYDAIGMAGDSANIPDATAPAIESVEEQRSRLETFIPSLQRLLKNISMQISEELSSDQIESETLRILNGFELISGDLTANQFASLQSFMNDPEQADSSVLDAFQDILDSTPGLVSFVCRDALNQFWLNNPVAMEYARRAGPREIRKQQRMVTLKDYVNRLEEHPLVMRAASWEEWGGAWNIVNVAIIVWNNAVLDSTLSSQATGERFEALRAQINQFHRDNALPEIDWDSDPAIRTILRRYIDAWRMIGQEVVLQNAEPVGISMALSIQVSENYFQSEIRRAVEQALGTGTGGFFEAGRLQFGEDLHAGDIFEMLMALDGIESVCLNRFKRVGRQFADMSESGSIKLDGLELAVCDNKPGQPERGYYVLNLHGGRRG